MRIPRIFCDAPLNSGDTVTLEGSPANHVSRVLRLKTGDVLSLFNGEGGEFLATVKESDKRHTLVEVGVFNDSDIESPLAIHLLQGISKGDRMDYTVQKAVELGVISITPTITERTVVRLDAKREAKKQLHWQQVVISACEQCGRNRIPQVSETVNLEQALAGSNGTRLMLDHRSGETIATVPLDNKITLLIGPEGGLSEAEREQAKEAGFIGVRMGPRILRTETAALVAIAILQSRQGDLL